MPVDYFYQWKSSAETSIDVYCGQKGKKGYVEAKLTVIDDTYWVPNIEVSVSWGKQHFPEIFDSEFSGDRSITPSAFLKKCGFSGTWWEGIKEKEVLKLKYLLY